MSEEKPREKDVPITREQFEDSKAGNYVKLEAEKDYIVAVADARYIMRDFGEGLKPTMLLVFDHFDGHDLDEPAEFTSGSKLLANMIEEYRSNESVNLLGWYFKMRKTGTGMQTKYTWTPHKPRPKGQQPAAKPGGLEAFA